MGDINRTMLNDTQQFFYDRAKEAGIPLTQNEIETEFQKSADTETLTFNNNSAFSPFWRFLRSVAVYPFQQLIAFVITSVMPNLFLKTAEKQYLNLIGWSRDVERKGKTALVGVITFYRINTGTSLPVAAGTVIKTPAIGGKVYRVVTTEEGAFGTDDVSIVIPVKAEKEGAEYNLAAGYFTSLETPITGITGVTNAEGWIITPGADDEGDEDYRQRIRARFSASSDWHVTAVYKSIIAEQIGIEFSRIHIGYSDAPRGPGSADAYVLFDDGVATGPYLDTVNDYIGGQGFHGLGDDLQVQAFPETQHDLSVILHARVGSSSADMDAAQAVAEQIIRCAFRQNSAYDVEKTWHYRRFSMANLAAEIMALVPALSSVEFSAGDIVSAATIPRLQSLTLTIAEDAYG